jgi:4-diphosphocytidyl-2-C-methyl-D-erythritol kinase
MSHSIRARAPAKLNLFLRVVGRRPDGFHELETVFQAVDLADELTFEPAEGLRLTGGSDEAPPGPENLVLQAAAALRAATGFTGGAAIHLEKRIPVGAGLGGGSSDAAATLAALNQLWGLGLSHARLAELAAGLGSDVPFFLQGGTAIGRGRGEVLEGIPSARGLAERGLESALRQSPETSIEREDAGRKPGARSCFVLARPPFPVPTARAYALYRPAGSKAPTLSSFLAALAAGDPEQVAPVLRNDLEAGVFEEWPDLPALRERLLAAGTLGARMTGSGSVLFGLARDEAHAREVAGRLVYPDLWVRVVRAVGTGVQVLTEQGWTG